MTDELTEKLKSAGFPEIGDAWMDKESGTQVFHEVPGWEKIYIPPTLENLIEACGSGLTITKHEGKWRAAKTKHEFWIGIGITPTEAVANLWLALNPQ